MSNSITHNIKGHGSFVITIVDAHNAIAKAQSAKAYAAVKGFASTARQQDAMNNRMRAMQSLVGNRYLEIYPA